MTTKWTEMPGYEGRYVISDSGIIISEAVPKVMKPQKKAGGYLGIRLSDSKGLKKNHTIHKLVMLAFKGDSALDVNHINGVKTDNSLSNLEYCTRKQNIQHAFSKGLSPKGERHPNSKLSKTLVEYIRRMRNTHGITYSAISKVTGVDARHVGKICRGELWK